MGEWSTSTYITYTSPEFFRVMDIEIPSFKENDMRAVQRGLVHSRTIEVLKTEFVGESESESGETHS